MKYKVGKPLLERGIILKLFEQFHIISHDSEDDLLQSPLTFKSCTLFIRVLHSILIFLIPRNHSGYFKNLSAYIIRVIPVDIAKHIVKIRQNNGK